MKKRRVSTEKKLNRLRELAKGPLSDDDKQEIRKSLASANNIVVAKTAQVIAKHSITELIPQLVAAFDRFMKNPLKTDKGCLAKTAIIEALDKLEYQESNVFLRGIRHAQMEPVYGGHKDTAANLRARCALAFARIDYEEVFFELTRLLADPEIQPRIAAVRSLTCLICETSELLLRLKILTGDEEPQVFSECFAGLMSIAPKRSLDFVAGFLTSSDLLIAEGAALALGESREPQAFEILRNSWEDSINHEFKEMLLLPIALTRSDEAFDFLIDVVRCEYQDYASAAVRALKAYADDSKQRQKIHQAVVSRNDIKVSEVYASEFGTEDDI
jgi:hypothetical protein